MDIIQLRIRLIFMQCDTFPLNRNQIQGRKQA